MTIKITLNNWSIQKEAARSVRMNVFVLEQKVPLEMEMDASDELCIHAVAKDATGTVIGTGRLLPDGHIGRMAVLASARSTGVGTQILHSLMRAAKERGDKRVVLNAQISAAGFYAKFGFSQIGDEFIQAGIKHIEMECIL